MSKKEMDHSLIQLNFNFFEKNDDSINIFSEYEDILINTMKRVEGYISWNKFEVKQAQLIKKRRIEILSSAGLSL